MASNEDYFREADRVFVGFVEGTQFIRPEADKQGSVHPETASEYVPFGYIKVDYDLRTVLKGPEEPVPVVSWNLYLGGCGVPVVTGAEMLFLVKDFSSYMTHEEAQQMPVGTVGMVLPFSHMIPPTDAAHEAVLEEWKEIAERVQSDANSDQP